MFSYRLSRFHVNNHCLFSSIAVKYHADDIVFQAKMYLTKIYRDQQTEGRSHAGALR